MFINHRIRCGASVLALLCLMLAGSALADDFDRAMDRGHDALDSADYRDAARAFDTARDEADGDSDLAEATYWHAFAMHRLGGKRDLRRAAEDLITLQDLELEESLLREARALAVRVKGELARMGDAEAARELAEVAEDQEDNELKLAALQAMMHMKPRRALPVVKEILSDRSAGTTELRRQAMFLLSQYDTDECFEMLLDAASNDPDTEVKEQAVFWLGQSGDPRALEFFRQLVINNDDPEVIEQAMFAVSQFDDEAASTMLRDIAADADKPAEIRSHAIFGLGHNGNQDDVRFLRELFGSIDDPELKEQIIFAAAQGNARASQKWLLDLVSDRSLDIESRKLALFWSGQEGMLDADELSKIYDSEDDREMREQVIFVLSQDNSEEAVQRLMDIARNETDLELRKLAVFWVGQSDAEGVEDLLMEIISQ